ncbi:MULTISPECIES: MBL fold metallo-hydrolase [unclassified Mycobacterium]|uniref:MBL fold metallo-hydrolase n=1 Tax=unclassified Mycobacterium TaxID=2642494 RepID=UPI0007FF0388|nr:MULTISPECIES: MBL fold metallo-hydrolase [unclassified Mycobacterium]OBG77188.1 Zn-dependent hydrolase [Mycobacterium sp. E1214]OBH27605.1 Zn-dependent hydrolase [Mycobacterium sp. E1319]
MSAEVDARRRDLAIAVLGGPTTVIDIAGLRIVMDPTFDPPGDHGYLTKLQGPAVGAEALGSVDAVLVSHDQHPDNFDDAGRLMALAAPLLLTHPGAADRLGPPALGLAPWESHQLTDGVAVQAVPAVHGPADGQRDAGGHVNCEVTGFVLSGPGLPTVYLSGDNASMAAVKDVAGRCSPIDVAVLFAGAARVPAKERGRPLTLTSARAAAAAELLGARVVVPAHFDGWAHFSEGLGDVVTAFDQAGIGDRLRVAAHGDWVDL